ncbi:MAG: AAA family ATPase [Deltaproteobacteria bacterium]|nr:AAA family ATPase [Deltaproteobacteria bacterium]
MLVGRRTELSRLTAAFQEAASGQGGVVAVVGDAGIGKTSLVRAFEPDAAVRRGYCYEAEWSAPFAPWAQIVPGAVAPRTPSGTADAHVERYQLFETVTQQLLDAARERPHVLVLEDVHWADGDSLGLLLHVARAIDAARVLVIITYRETEEAPALTRTVAAMHRDVRLHRIPLAPFDRAEIAAFVGDAGAPHVDWLSRETGGNPLYVRELWRHLADAGDPASAPASVREIVRHRLSLLAPATAELLQIASAFVAPFTIELIAAVTGGDPTAALDEAVRVGLLDVSPGGGFELVHAVVRRAIHDDLGPLRGARLHRRIAEALPPRAAAEVAAQYHASASIPGAERGIDFAITAAEQAARATAHERAVQIWKLAVDLAAEDQRRGSLLGRLALAQAIALMPDDARRSADAALELLGDDAIAPFVADLAVSLKATGAPSLIWEPLVERALPRATKPIEARLRLLRERYADLATGPLHIGQWLGPDPEAVALARETGDPIALAMISSPFEARTAEETRALLAAARETGDPVRIVHALDLAQRDLYHRQNDCSAALVLLDEMLARANALGSIPLRTEALYGIAKCRAVTGDLPGAHAAARDVPALLARLGPAHRLRGIAPIAMNCALGYFDDTDWDPVIAQATSFVEQPRARRTPLGFVVAGFAAVALAMDGQRDRCDAWLRTLLPIFERGDATMYNYRAALELCAVAAWTLELVERAPALLALEQRIPTELGALPWSCSALERARMSSLAGDPDAALAGFTEARRVLAQRGHYATLALIDLDEALALGRARTGADRRNELLHAAVARFDDLRMRTWSERARQLLGRGSDAPDGLTRRELEVLRLLAQGQSNKQIATVLFLSAATVQRHIANIYAKIDVTNRTDATRYALRHGIAT